MNPRFFGYFGTNSEGEHKIAYSNFSNLIDKGIYQNIGLDTLSSYQYPILAKYIPQGRKVECVRLEPVFTIYITSVIEYGYEIF